MLELHHAAFEMWHVPFFRIFYSTSFTLLLIITLALLAVSPIDIGYQSNKIDQKWNIVIIAGVYVLVALVTLFIYATRLYTTRTHLASIPKSRVPLQKGDLPKSVRRLILAGIERSASIAFKARPRDLTNEQWLTSEVNAARHVTGAEPRPTWGLVSHPGCSAPHDPELPDMHYEPVIAELPHLLEARAVSLAPADPLLGGREDDPEDETRQIPDPRAVAYLQRPLASSLRAYITRLADLGVLDSTEQAAEFVQRYEIARFAGPSLHERDFHDLMETFAMVLDTVQDPDPELLAAMMDDEELLSTTSARSTGGPFLERRNRSQISTSIRQQKSMASLASRSENSVRRTQSRPKTRDTLATTGSSVDGSDDFVTPGLTPGLQSGSPFYTPYPAATSTKSTSTGSLAGSEATIETARSRIARTPHSGKRTPSAFSRRSRGSGRSQSRRSRSRGTFGLGLGFTKGVEHSDDERDENNAPEKDASDTGSVVRGQRGLTSEVLGGSETPREAFQSDEMSGRPVTSESQGSEVRSMSSSDSVIVRRSARKAQPGMFGLNMGD